MKILSTTLFIGFMSLFTATAHAGSDGSEDQVAQQPKPRLANCKDCIDAGYRRGYADAEAAALENTPAGSSSVTTPLSYRKPVYVQAPTTQPRQVQTKQPVRQAAPVARIQQSYTPVKQAHQSGKHAGHGHHTEAQRLDCELTDSLNRGAGIVKTVLSTKQYFQPSATQHNHAHVQRPTRHVQHKAKTVVKHGNHYHHSAAEKADCELTDALNRNAGTITTVISSNGRPQHSPVKHQAHKQHFAHGNHSHHSEVERADCALTDALNRGGSLVRVVRKY